VQDDCIAVALGLPQLKILWQKELEDHFEVTVIYRRAVQMCLPQAKVVVNKFHLLRHINGALDKVRSRLQGGSRRGKRRDLFKSRYTLLKGAERLADWEK